MSLSSSIAVAALAGTLVLVGGCTTLESSWKSTKSFYYTYINAPAVIDYEEKGTLSEAELRLATRMVGIDIQLEHLERYLLNADRPPTGESINLLFTGFPWLSGLVAIDPEGNVLAQEPPVSMKNLDFSGIAKTEARGGEMRGLRGFVQDTPLGPEVMVGIPVYMDSEMRGMLVTHFDMRTLLSYTNGTEDLVVLAPEGVLWDGDIDVPSTPLYGQDWAEIVRSSTQGTVSNNNGEFIWIARFLGKQPLIFATPVRGTFRKQNDSMGISPFGLNTPVTESQLLDQSAGSLLLAPLPPVRGLDMEEQPISD